MTAFSLVRLHWIPVLSMDARWEVAFAEAVRTFDPSGRFCSTRAEEYEAEVFVFAYEAVDHQDAISQRKVADFYARYPAAARSRVVLAAFSRSRPRVHANAVRQLMHAQIGSSTAARHPARVMTTSDVSSVFADILSACVSSLNAEKDFAAANASDASPTTSSKPGELELWIQ